MTQPTDTEIRERMEHREKAHRNVFARGKVPAKDGPECSHSSGEHIPRDCKPWPELGEGVWLATCLWCKTSYALQAEDVPDRYVALEELAAVLDTDDRKAIERWMRSWGIFRWLTEDES